VDAVFKEISSFVWWLGLADEIAAAVANLSSSSAAYASGAVLQVDGGQPPSAQESGPPRSVL
jgi:NAD(P)-dependent dehydrogenase (short-subunit alcohol dehydrogenase family)